MLESPGWRSKALPYFSSGLLIGGFVTGVLVGLFGALLGMLASEVAAGIVVLAVLAGLAHDFGIVHFPLPQRAKLVPKEIDRRGVMVAALQFGFEMGTGFRTFIPSAAPYVLVVTVLLVGDLATAALAGTAFGAGRAAMTVSRFLSSKRVKWDQSLSRRLDQIVRACAILSAAAIIALPSVCSVFLGPRCNPLKPKPPMPPIPQHAK